MGLAEKINEIDENTVIDFNEELIVKEVDLDDLFETQTGIGAPQIVNIENAIPEELKEVPKKNLLNNILNKLSKNQR